MIPRRVKATYFALLTPAMWLNQFIYRFVRAPRSGTVRVHLGPGQKNYLAGWINLDANFVSARIDLWADLRHGLPFPDSSVDAFYSHHVIEHLPDAYLPDHLAELIRCLKPGGMLRLGCPSADNAISKFMEGDLEWFGEWPDKRSSIGGRFANFLLCRGEHTTILTFTYMEELLHNAGFQSVVQFRPRETGNSSLINQELLLSEEDATGRVPATMIVEASKPFQ